MWPWVVALITTILGAGVALYYRSQAGDTTSLLTENKKILNDVNALLLALANRAKATGLQDKKDSLDVKTAAEGADFLNASTAPRAGLLTPTGRGTSTKLRATRRSPTSPAIRGFVRDRGWDRGFDE